ncbi:MAG TPA: TRAP transporter large permease subunit [Acetobacteraceae bacterium]
MNGTEFGNEPPGDSSAILLRIADCVGKAVIVAALLGELAVTFLNVLVRGLFGESFLWTDEIARIALSTLAFIGGVVAYRRGHHAILRLILDRLHPRASGVFLAAAKIMVLGLAILVFILSLTLVQGQWDRETPILEWPASVFVLPLTVSMPILALYAAENLRRLNRRTAALGIGLVAVIAALVLATKSLWLGPVSNSTSATVALLVLFVVSGIGLPIGFGLIGGAATYFWISGAPPMIALPQKMVDGTGNFVLLALPFFIFAGLIMERGGISQRLIAFVHALVGHLRGGLLQVMVISMYLVSGLSGSKTADVAAVGTSMRQMLAQEGYSAGEGAAVLASAAVMGDTVPPSLGILVLGSITQLSIASMFIGGIIPAAVIGVCLMVLIWLKSQRLNLPRRQRAPLRLMLRTGLVALVPLSMPAVLFIGILGGFATPTEVSSVAVVYGLLLATLVYRGMTLQALFSAALDSATLAGMILFILAAASSFSWALTVANLPQQLVQVLQTLQGSNVIFMLGSIALLVLTGMLLEGLPALNILAPLLVPIAGHFGFSGVHYGLVLLIAMGMGAFLPPAGVGFFVCCAIARTTIEQASRAMVPYLAVLVIGLLIVAFVPWFTLVLPRAFGFAE